MDDLNAGGDSLGVDGQQHRYLLLVDAISEVQRLSSADSRDEHLLASLDRLHECAETSFREQEEAVACLGSSLNAEHRKAHAAILRQIALLHRRAEYGDKAGLLVQLLFLDRWLTSHFFDELVMPSGGYREHLPSFDGGGVRGLHAAAR